MRRNYRRPARRTTYRRNRRPTGIPRGLTYQQILKKVAADVYKVKQLVNTEFKSHNVAISGTISSTATLALLNAVTIGDTIDSRDGNTIRLKSVEYNLQFAMVGAVPADCRVILALWKSPRGVAPATADIATSITSLRDLDNRRDLLILRDHKWTMVAGASSQTKLISNYRKIDMKQVFNANNNGDITDIEEIGLYLFFMSTIAPASDPPTVSGNARIRFIDN